MCLAFPENILQVAKVPVDECPTSLLQTPPLFRTHFPVAEITIRCGCCEQQAQTSTSLHKLLFLFIGFCASEMLKISCRKFTKH